MSGMLHPEGPEPAQTYWLRRAMVLLALVIAVLLGVGVAGAVGATRQDAEPTAGQPPAVDSPSDASLSPSSSGSSDASTGPSTSASTSPSAVASPSSGSTVDPNGSSSAAVVTPACQRSDLKAAVVGKQMLKLSQPAAFTVTVRNDGDETCRLSLTRNDFELKVTDGKKLLWSSRACSTATFAVAAKLELDQTMSWSMLWDGRGTAAGCAQPGPELKRGTYLATATVTGTKAAELPVTLRP